MKEIKVVTEQNEGKGNGTNCFNFKEGKEGRKEGR
jgi:hypothetical protein